MKWVSWTQSVQMLWLLVCFLLVVGLNALRDLRISRASSLLSRMYVVFGRPGAGKTTITNAVLDFGNQLESSTFAVDLDICVSDTMRANFAKNIYPTLQERQRFALDACKYVQEQIIKSKKETCLVSFSFVNNDLRDTFRMQFPHAKWILIDTPDSLASQRIATREGHFYKQETIKERGPEWLFDDVDFDHISIKGNLPVGTIAAQIVSFIQSDIKYNG